MEKTASVQVSRADEFLRASINHEGIKINISSKNPNQALSDIRRIMECVGIQEVDPLEDFATFEMTTLLSDEFTANASAMNEMKRLLGMEQQYRVVKELMSAVEEIDLYEGKKTLSLDTQTIRAGVRKLLSDISVSSTRHALIHIKGLLAEHERLVIVDRIHEQMPHVRIKAYQTEQDIEGKVLIEALVFGDFEAA